MLRYLLLLLCLIATPLWAQDIRPSAYLGQAGKVTVRSGKVLGSTGGVTTIAEQTITPANSATTYIYIDLSSTPAVATSTTGFPTSNYFPICTVIKDANGIITSFTDSRPDFFMSGSGSGSPSPGVFNSNFDPPLFQNYSLTTTGGQAGINLTANPIDTHTISWRPSGTVTTCTVAVDTSADGVSWTAGGAIAGQTCTSAGSFTVGQTYSNFVRVNLTTLTGGGTLTVVYSGRLAPPASIGNTNPVSNAIAVNAGELVTLNLSGSNVSNATFFLTARFRSLAGTVSYLQANTTTTTCTGVVMAQCTPFPYVAFPSAGWLEIADAVTTTANISTSQVSAQIYIGCANLGLTGTGTMTSTQWNTCASQVQLANSAMSTFQHFNWPVLQPLPTMFPPWLNTSTVSNPSAGAQWAYTVSPLVRTTITGISFTLVTNATIANRYPGIFVQCNGTNTWFSMQASAPQVASSTTSYVFVPGIGPVNAGVGGSQYLPLPSGGLEFASGDACGGSQIIQSFVTGMQSGDQVQTIVIRSKVWEENN